MATATISDKICKDIVQTSQQKDEQTYGQKHYQTVWGKATNIHSDNYKILMLE